MSRQYLKLEVMAAKLAKSASSNWLRVSSENTTPQPKVSSGRLRSQTTISASG